MKKSLDRIKEILKKHEKERTLKCLDFLFFYDKMAQWFFIQTEGTLGGTLLKGC